MISKEKLEKLLLQKSKRKFSDEECEWITYYESLKSRKDKEHENKDPLVGALIRDKDGHILDVSHRASGQEGDHAEFVLLTKKLAGHDFSGCHLFTTLEPCVDDCRSGVGKSCSSIISKSEIKDVHIGILDPNTGVYGRGVSFLFNSGIKIYPYNGEVAELIIDSCDAFKNPSTSEAVLLNRFKKDVFKYFDEDAVKLFLKDCSNQDTNLDSFILDMIRRRLVIFDAKNIKVADSIQILFYKNKFLSSSLNRSIKIIDLTNPEVDREVETLDGPLPISFHILENKFKSLNIDAQVLREIIANLMIHRAYGVDNGLGSVEISETEATFINEASKNLSHEQLKDFTELRAESKPGDGIIADYFNKAFYCERSKKGQKTFKEMEDKITIKLNENDFVSVTFKYFR